MAPRWAAFAAVLAARGERWAQGCRADRNVWHYDDGGGNWADVVLADGGRAVLVGHDHEYSTTYFREGAQYFGEPETDLLAGCPTWWEPTIAAHLERQRTQGMWIGFVYGFDGGWSRADYTLDDGFTSVRMPFVDAQATASAIVDLLTSWCATLHLSPADNVDVAVRELIEAGSEVSERALHRALGPAAPHADTTRAMNAAQAFARP